MNTARDLVIVAIDTAPDHPLERGDLSLALAGAEVLDLLDPGAVSVDGDRLVPGTGSKTGDRLLDEAAELLVRQEPYESVEDWLWRRGRGLSAAYVTELEKEGLTAKPRGLRNPLRAVPTELVDSPDKRRAEERWAAGEPVLVTLASAAGFGDEPAEDSEDITEDAVTAVLAAVGDAVMELEAVRQRKQIQDAAYDNIWRGM
jgi:hypothetical protein